MSADPALGRIVQLREVSTPWEVRAHPRGAQGIREAMAWMVDRIASDARDPRVIAWTRNELWKAQLPDARGFPNHDRMVAAIFKALKREAIFVRDPVDTEAILSTVQVLALDPADLQAHGGDCDCLVRACASCLLAVGIPVRLDLRFYPKQNQAHIMIDYDRDPKLRGEWSCLDPSVESGACSTASHQGQIVMEVVMGQTDRPGTFVGMSGPLEPWSMGDPPTDLGTSNVQAWVELAGWVQAELAAATTRLQNSTAAYTALRTALGLPQYDTAAPVAMPNPEAPAAANAGPLATYWASKNWTAAAQTAETQLLNAAQFCSSCLKDALAGTRAMYWNNTTAGTSGDVLIASKAGDPYRLAFVTDSSGNTTLQFLDPSTGASTGTMGAIGLLDILIGGAVIAAVTVAVSWAVTHYCDSQAIAHHDDALTRLTDQQAALVAAGQQTPAQATQFLQAATGFANASPVKSAPSAVSWATLLGGAALGAVAGGVGVYFGLPLLKRTAA